MPSVNLLNHLNSLNQDAEKVKALVPQAYRLLKEGKANEQLFQSPYKELFKLNPVEISYSSWYGYDGDLSIWLRDHLYAEMEKQKYATPKVTKLINAVKSGQNYLRFMDVIISLMETKKFIEGKTSKEDYQRSITEIKNYKNIIQKVGAAFVIATGLSFMGLGIGLAWPFLFTAACTHTLVLVLGTLMFDSAVLMGIGAFLFKHNGNKERKEVAEIMEEISNSTPEFTQVKSSDFPSSSANNSGFFQAAKVYPDLNDEPRLNLGNV